MVKAFYKNQKADDLVSWYVAFGIWGLPSYSNDSRLTLTYLKARSNLLFNVFKWEIF